MHALTTLTALAEPHVAPRSPGLTSVESILGALLQPLLFLCCSTSGTSAKVLARTPVSTPALQAMQDNSCTDRACHLMDELTALPLGAQKYWLVLSGRLRGRVRAAIKRAENKAVDSAFDIMSWPH